MTNQKSLKEFCLENYYIRLCAIVSNAFGPDVVTKYRLASRSLFKEYDEDPDYSQKVGMRPH